MMLSSMFTKMLGEGAGERQRCHEQCARARMDHRLGVPFAILLQGRPGWVEERGNKAREEDAHSTVFLQKPVAGKQSLNFSELTS